MDYNSGDVGPGDDVHECTGDEQRSGLDMGLVVAVAQIEPCDVGAGAEVVVAGDDNRARVGADELSDVEDGASVVEDAGGHLDAAAAVHAAGAVAGHVVPNGLEDEVDTFERAG